MVDSQVLCERLPPLVGYRVGITADRRAEEQAELLRRLGATVTTAPVIRTLALGDDTPLREATEALLADPPTMVLLTTGIGVRGWIAAAEAWGLGPELLRMLMDAPLYARGPKAYAAAAQAGLRVWRREPTERLDAMVAHLAARPMPGAHIALQLYGHDVPEAISALTAAGARVTPVPIYHWVPPDDDSHARRLIRDALDGQLDAITLTCPAAAASLCRIADEAGLLEALLEAFADGLAAACVGPVTRDAAVGLGIKVACAPGVGRLGLLVRAIGATLHARHLHLDVAGRDIVLHGSTVFTTGADAELTTRERAVLGALARRAGVVVAKPRVAAEVWGRAEDVRALDATVARLRRHLSPLGLVVTAVPRRGYRLEATRSACPARELRSA